MNTTIARNLPRYKKRFPQVANLILQPSRVGNKRLTAMFDIGGKRKMVNFGLRGAVTYADGASKKKRDSYRARASKIKNKKGQFTYLLPGTANSFAYWLLW